MFLFVWIRAFEEAKGVIKWVIPIQGSDGRTLCLWEIRPFKAEQEIFRWSIPILEFGWIQGLLFQTQCSAEAQRLFSPQGIEHSVFSLVFARCADVRSVDR